MLLVDYIHALVKYVLQFSMSGEKNNFRVRGFYKGKCSKRIKINKRLILCTTYTMWCDPRGKIKKDIIKPRL